METEVARRPNRGPLRAVIFDWAGTTVDYGSRAPAGVFSELFRRHGVAITMGEARGPMGMHKRDHIAAILAMPDVAARWEQACGARPGPEDVRRLYEELIPLQLACLRDHADLIPGTIEAVADCRRRGLKIGSTTGYNREMLEVLLAEARRQGYDPDCAVSADEVPAGRPHPYMCLLAAIRMQVYPMEAMVKVGDTAPDIAEGLNCGMWTVAVARTGNEIGLSEEEVAALPRDELEARCAAARARLREAGAHFVIDSVAELPAVLDEIERCLASEELVRA